MAVSIALGIGMNYTKMSYGCWSSHLTREAMGKHAYETITNTWNAQEAARRLVDLIRAISEGVPSPELYLEGPCSRA